jgi:hypothetical protein
MSGAGELRSAFASTAGGVMTEEAGAVTGDLELLTRPTHDGRAIEALVRYAGARELYAVSGSPVRAVSEGPDEEEHRAAHGRILGLLTAPGRADEAGNELPTDLLRG